VGKYDTAGQATGGNTIRRMNFVCLILKGTDTHPEYVMLLVFLLQQQLRERASLLRYVYNACLVWFLAFIKAASVV
jgi:hypothetical protein